MNHLTGVLLINLGTPKTPKFKDVYRYLVQFLTDKRVIDKPWLKRQLLVRGLIVPSRVRQSAKSYREIWTPKGSPLLVYGHAVRDRLQEELGKDFEVRLAMRYQEPSIQGEIEELISLKVSKLIIIPLFPQYASASSGSVLQKVMEVLAKYPSLPEIKMINQFYNHPDVIKAYCDRAKNYSLKEYDHIIFSFHGLPLSQLKKSNYSNYCLTNNTCCHEMKHENKECYSAQCYKTASLIAENLKIEKEKYSITFQSRLGKEPWIEPYTVKTILELARQNKKRVLVFCPAFVADCLETTYEIENEYFKEFVQAGGEKLDLVPSLNEHPLWIKALKSMIV